MKLLHNFKFGRFKLESYFVTSYCDNVPYIITINDIVMTIWEAKCDINEKLSKGETIQVLLGDAGPVYLIRIEDKEWVYIEKI